MRKKLYKLNNKILNLKKIVKDKKGKRIFSIRDIGDIPKVRARNFIYMSLILLTGSLSFLKIQNF